MKEINFFFILKNMTAGTQFRKALKDESPLQVAGTLNAYTALMAERIGFRAIYLSGAGVANASYGIPDIGETTLDNVLEDAIRITQAVDLPLLVDIDTGWENVGHAIEKMIEIGVAGVHLEDQIPQKLCGHLPGKQLVSKEEMVARLHAANQAKSDPDFFIIARTDALAVEGQVAALERSFAYSQAGADAIFLEAATTLEQYQACKSATNLPILANITEFGRTPLYNLQELKNAGVDMVLYPLTAARVMYKAAYQVLKEIREKGTQKDCIDRMQTREELYDFLRYEKDDNKN